MRFHAADDNLRPGWDGIVEQNDFNPWVPQGKSYWEISTRADFGRKARSDYEKRLQTPQAEREKTTFVIVSLRPYAGTETLQQELQQKHAWADVRVYDAENIAEWLRLTPHLWPMAAELFGTGDISTICTLEIFQNRWSGQCSPRLTSALFLSQAEYYRDVLLRWLKAPKGCFTIFAENLTEGAAFLHAVMEHQSFSPYRDRIIVFRNSDTAQAFLLRAPQAIAVTNDTAVCEACVSGMNPVPLIHVVPLQTQLPENDCFAFVGRMDSRSVEAFTQTLSAENKRRVEEIVAQNGYSRSALRRKLLNFTPRPAWAESLSRCPTVVAVGMLGMWNPKRKSVCDAVASLSGHSKEESLQELRDCLKGGESPVCYCREPFQYGGVDKVWCPSSPRELWEYALAVLTPTQKKQFLFMAEKMLISSTQEYQAADLLPLCRSLIVLFEYTDESNFEDAADFVESVRRLLEERLTALPVIQLLQQPYLLPYMAELVPAAWNRWVDSLLGMGSDILSQVWKDKPLPFLVDALSRFAIPARYFLSSMGHLLRMWKLAPGDNCRKSIGKAIQRGLIVWFPQTQAFLPQRQEILQLICREAPSLGWDICMGNLVLNQAVMHVSTHRCAPEWSVPSRTSGRDCVTVRLDSIKRLLEWPNCTAEQMRDLFSLAQFYTHPWCDDILKKVLEETSAYEDERRVAFYEQALNMMAELRVNKNQAKVHWFRCNVIPPLKPTDAVLRYRWFFSKKATQLFYRRSFNLKNRAVVRGYVLKRFLRQNPQRLSALVNAQQVDAHSLGVSMVVTFPVQEMVAEWYRLMLNPAPLTGQETEYLKGMSETLLSDRLAEPLRDLLRTCSAEQALKMLTPLAPSSLCLQLLSNCPDFVQAQYWQKVPIKRYNTYTDQVELVVDNLLEAHRPEDAWVMLEMDYRKYPASLVSRVVAALALAYGKRINFPISWHFGIPNGESSDNAPDFGIAEVISYLKEAGAVSLARAAAMEFRFADIFASHGYEFPYLSEILAENPRMAARLAVHLTDNATVEKAMGEIDYFRLASLFRQCISGVNIMKALQNDAALEQWGLAADAELIGLSASAECRREFAQFFVFGNLHNLQGWLTDDVARITEYFLTPLGTKSPKYARDAYSSKLMSKFRWADVGDDSSELCRKKRRLSVELKERAKSLIYMNYCQMAEVLKDAAESFAREANDNNPVEP